MTSWSDWEDDEKVEAAGISEIINGAYEQLMVGFGILRFFVLTKIHQYTLRLSQFMLKLIAQESYRAFNMKKKINPEGLENGAIDVINEKLTVCLWWAVITGFIILAL